MNESMDEMRFISNASQFFYLWLGPDDGRRGAPWTRSLKGGARGDRRQPSPRDWTFYYIYLHGRDAHALRLCLFVEWLLVESVCMRVAVPVCVRLDLVFFFDNSPAGPCCFVYGLVVDLGCARRPCMQLYMYIWCTVKARLVWLARPAGSSLAPGRPVMLLRPIRMHLPRSIPSPCNRSAPAAP
jgi:hypothetical protein